MRSKYQHENSYACLLAEVLEEEDEQEKDPIELPGASKIGASAAKSHQQALVAVEDPRRLLHRQRRGGGAPPRIAAASTATCTPTSASSTPTSASSSSSAPPPPTAPSPRLVEIDDPGLPEVLKFNRFVQTGYRRAPLSRRECLCSLRYCHNETFNVLSHLVPLLLIAAALATGALASTWPGKEAGDLSLLLHALPVLLCLAGSVAYHLLSADAANYARYLSVDVCGILVLTVEGTRAMAARPAGCLAAAGGRGGFLELLREVLVSPWAAAKAGSPASSPLPSLSSWASVSSAALARDAALASYAALVVFAANKAFKGKTAAERGCPLLALLLARFAVLAARAAEVKTLTASSPSSSSPEVASLRASLGWYACAEAASFVGGLVNVMRVPERWVKPLPPPPPPPKREGSDDGGKNETPRFRFVDFAFNSHNLMHLLSLVALGCYHAAVREDRRHWLEHGCGNGGSGSGS